MSLFEAKVDYSEYAAFKKDAQEKIKALDDSLAVRLAELEQEIRHKATDSELQAREAANNSLVIEGNIRGVESRVEEILQALDEIRKSVSTDALDISKQRGDLSERNVEMLAAIEQSKSIYNDFLRDKSLVDEAVENIYKDVESIRKILAGSEALSEQVETVAQLSSKAGDGFKNISGLLDGALKRKAALDELYKDVMGYEIKGEDGEVQVVEGLRSQLENSYEDVKGKVENVEASVAGVVKEISDSYTLSMGEQKDQFEKFISDSVDRVNSVDDELKALLPGSLAAGLSAAYEAKKDEEKISQLSYSKQFGRAIVALVFISCIPFAIDAYLLVWKAKDIVDVIKDTPSLILSILPLYFPVLWYAFSTSKKLNLSKRLIEEYTHKAVLGRTFSGLSNQIVNLPHESAVKEDLRTRLLFNLLQVSSENPGKLITDYNKSDHPFMEALENSAKLSASVETLTKLPGFSAMAEKLSRKKQDIDALQSQQVSDGISAQEALEEKVASNSAPKTS